MKSHILPLLILSLFLAAAAPGLRSERPPASLERSFVVGHIANPEEQINRKTNTIYLTTYYFGDFYVAFPQDMSLDGIEKPENIKVFLSEPAERFEESSSGIAMATGFEPLSVQCGVLSERGEDYLDIFPWEFPRDNSDLTGTEPMRFAISRDTAFSRPIEPGEDVMVVYEMDGEQYTALLITGFVG